MATSKQLPRVVPVLLVVIGVHASVEAPQGFAGEQLPCGLFSDYKENRAWEPDPTWHAVNSHSEWEFLAHWFGQEAHTVWEWDTAQSIHPHGDSESCG